MGKVRLSSKNRAQENQRRSHHAKIQDGIPICLLWVLQYVLESQEQVKNLLLMDPGGFSTNPETFVPASS